MPNKPGTYILLLKLADHCFDLTVGRSLSIDLEPGGYCYVGSALGPGGLAARLGRHYSPSKRKHWHIDYLLPHVQHMGTFFKEDEARLECLWATWIDRIAARCVIGFGASDCRCRGHLFYLDPDKDDTLFIQKTQRELEAQYRISGEITTLSRNRCG